MVDSVANAALVHVRGRLSILLFGVRFTADFTAWVYKGVLGDILRLFNVYVLRYLITHSSMIIGSSS